VGSGRDQAIVEIRPIGREAADWAARLRGMYAAWAERKGYEHESFEVGSGSSQARDVSGRPRSVGLFVRGPGVFDLLSGEAGLHRLTRSVPDDYQRGVARVVVHGVAVAPPDDSSVRLATFVRLIAEAATTDGYGDESVIARVYHEGSHRFVRDPRTGLRRGDYQAVVQEGKIDAFLLASLRQRADVLGT